MRMTTRSTPRISLPADREILDGLLPSTIQTIGKPLAMTDADEIALRDLKYIGSYNWVESEKPTIIVPGRSAWNSMMFFQYD